MSRGEPTRLNGIGLAGRKPAESGVQPSEQQDAGTLSDPELRQYVIEVPLVASAAEQDSGFTMPDHALSVSGFLRVRVASTGGAAQTINVGIFGGDADALLVSGDLSSIADLPLIQNIDLGGDNIGWTFAGADITGFEGELVLTVLASDV